MIMKKNNSSEFMLPMLGGNKKLFFYNSLLLNCYIGTTEDKDCIVTVYKDSNSLIFNKFERAIIRLRSFIKAYDIDNYIVFIFSIPKYYKKNYKKFLNGKYSEFSLDYKLQILEFHDQEIDDRLGTILFKSEHLRQEMEEVLDAKISKDSELYSVPTMKEEIFNLTKYINYEQSIKNPA